MKFKQTSTTFSTKILSAGSRRRKTFLAQAIGRLESYGDSNGHRLWLPSAGIHFQFHNSVTNPCIIELFIYLNSSHKALLRKNHFSCQLSVTSGQQWSQLATAHWSLVKSDH